MSSYFLVLAAILSAFTLNAQQIQEGMASVFDDSFNGKETRYGVKYDKRELTCAHNLHPFGSQLRVTRLDNKRSVNVRVIDEGPFIKGRIIELSRRAGESLGMSGSEEVLVRVELLRLPATDDTRPVEIKPETVAAKTAPETTPRSMENVSAPPPTPQNAPADRAMAASTGAAPVFTERKAAEVSQAKLVRKDYTKHGLYQVQLRKPPLQGWGVQVSSSTNSDNILQEIANLQAKSFDNILLSIEKGDLGKTYYKYILGPFDTEEKARQYLVNLKKRHKMPDAFVVNLAKGNY